VWLQARRHSNFADKFPLLLNPNGGNVGVGTTTPGYTLDVNGTFRAYSAGLGSNGAFLSLGGVNGNFVQLDTGPNTGGNQCVGVGFNLNGTEKFRYSSTGVGIGTTNPYSKLDVNGGSIIHTNSSTSSHGVFTMGNGEFLTIEAFNSGNTSKLPISLNAYGGSVGIGTTAPGYKLTVTGDICANGGWVRVVGDAGFYCETWGGGWNMTDATYLRSYNNKQVYASNYFYTDSGYKVGGTVIVDSSRNLTNIGNITASGTIASKPVVCSGSIISTYTVLNQAAITYADSYYYSTGITFDGQKATVQVPGYYDIYGRIFTNVTMQGSVILMALFVNGVYRAVEQGLNTTGGATSRFRQRVYMSANDYVEIRNVSGFTITVSGGTDMRTYFEMFYLGIV
jgi:hypothetical protein